MQPSTNKNMTTQQVQLERRSPSYWRVTFNNPPLNIWGPEATAQMLEIVKSLETDPNVKVVVFDSAVEGFFIIHYDFLAKTEDTLALPVGATGLRMLFECWLQFRGEAGERQLPAPTLGLTHNLGGRPGRCVCFIGIVGSELS